MICLSSAFIYLLLLFPTDGRFHAMPPTCISNGCAFGLLLCRAQRREGSQWPRPALRPHDGHSLLKLGQPELPGHPKSPSHMDTSLGAAKHCTHPPAHFWSGIWVLEGSWNYKWFC